MQTRKPIVSGQFYPAGYDSCVEQMNEFIDSVTPEESLPAEIVAGIVPHAGWVFSGRLAAMVFSAIKQQHKTVNTFVIFGAAHSYFGTAPAIYDKGCWLSPLGEIVIDEDLAQAVLASGTAYNDIDAHKNEHSIEVQIPFIQHLFGGAKVLPILTPPGHEAVELGEALAGVIKDQAEKKIVCIGSTDLTHYGPRYGFAPVGEGQQGFAWATNVNDKRLIELALKLDSQGVLADAAENCSACGAGAAAAAIATAKNLGVTKGKLLAHTNSSEITIKQMNRTSSESVGYAAMIF